MVEGVLSLHKILLQKFSDVTKDQLQQVKCALHFWRSALAPNKTYWEKTQRANLCLSATPFQLLTIKFCSYKLRSYTVYRILLFKKKKHLSNTVVVAAENTLQEISENTFESLIFSVFLRNKADGFWKGHKRRLRAQCIRKEWQFDVVNLVSVEGNRFTIEAW